MKELNAKLDSLQHSLCNTIFINAQEPMLVLGTDLTVLLVNKAALKLLGWADASLGGKPASELVLEKDIKEFSDLTALAAKNGVVRNYRFYMLTASKSIARLFLTVQALKDEAGAVNGFCLYLSPVSPDEWSALKDPHVFRNAARKLGRLTSIGQLTSMFAHDIKNPLHVILSTSELLRVQEGQPEQVKTGAELIERNARRASKIVKTLLDFSRSGMCRLEPYSINDAAEYSLELIDSALKAAKVRVDKQLGEAPKVFLDPHYLHSVIYNLLNNAAQALAGVKDASIKISSGWLPEEKEVHLTITDNGPGMEPAMLENLFQPFFTTKENGTGLGLYLARQIIDEHGGRILVSSPAGEGASVSLRFRKTV
ncbi:MAG: PAS domain-containing protein [Elusimicrobia bacterium]|nr:PAS domain-containing protein [Elusimicrobiota bacterium]